jgi:hypothetical protein
MTLSKAPSPHDLFTAARTQIFSEHGALRARLGETLSVGDAAAGGDRAAVAELPRLVICCLAELKGHLGFEESVLVPLLAASGQSGKTDAASLVRTHRDQRERLGRLIERATSAREPPLLAAELRSLVDEVFTDMAEEERNLIRAQIVAVGEATAPFLVELRRPV